VFEPTEFLSKREPGIFDISSNRFKAFFHRRNL
jgi:hypothetical protein